MQQLSWDEFSGAEGTVYLIDIDGGQLEFILEKAAELLSSGRAEGSFRLEFLGPLDPILPQATYRFHLGAESAEIFIVPVGREAKGTLYEAVFY